MILLLRVHLFTIETITTDTCIQEMHPSITGVAEGSYPTPEQISYYIYKFANRYANKGEVDHLNESICGRDHETEKALEKLVEELEEESDDEESTDNNVPTKENADEDTSEKVAETVAQTVAESIRRRRNGLLRENVPCFNVDWDCLYALKYQRMVLSAMMRTS